MSTTSMPHTHQLPTTPTCPSPLPGRECHYQKTNVPAEVVVPIEDHDPLTTAETRHNKPDWSRGPMGRYKRRSRSFDFGVTLDPSPKLIESFLESQTASGIHFLDMHGMNLMEKLGAVSGTSMENANLAPVAENSDTNAFTTQKSGNCSFSKGEIVESEEDSASPSSNVSLESSPRRKTSLGEQRGVSFLPTQVFECPQGELSSSISFADERSVVSPGIRYLQSHESHKSLHDDGGDSDGSEDEAQVRRSALRSLNRIQARSRLADFAPLPQADVLKFVQKSGELSSAPIRPSVEKMIEEEEDDPLKHADLPEIFRKEKLSFTSVLQWIAFFLIVGGLVCSLAIPRIKERSLLSMALWKWILVAFLIFCGRFVSGWIIRILVLILERSVWLRKRVLYFVYALRTGVQNCLWFAFALLAWSLVFGPRLHGTTYSNVLPYVTKVLNCFLIAAIIWLIKVFCVKMLASSFHVTMYFERIRESLFGQWILETLSGMPVIEMEEEARLLEEVDALQKAGAKVPDLLLSKGQFVGGLNVVNNEKLETIAEQGKSGMIIGGGKSGVFIKSGTVRRKSEQSMGGNLAQEGGISVDDLHRLTKKNISAWNMKRMMNMVRSRGIYTLAHVRTASTSEDESLDVEIQSEWQAKVAAKKMFQNVAKPGARFIEKIDIMRFIRRENVDKAMGLFEGALDSSKITKDDLKNFTVHVFRERRALALSLNDTKSAVNKLQSLVNVVVFGLIIIVSLLVLGLATTQILLFVSSQLILVVVIFGNTCKTVFEAIIFLFVMHPFDVGDRCIVDGNQVVVEEMNLLSTLFMRYDGEKIWYPNPLLSTKYILNCYRTPDTGEMFNFSIQSSTPVEKIVVLKERIAKYIASQPCHWMRDHHLMVLDIEDNNKMKMQLMVNHTINYHDVLERQIRRSDLILEVKSMLQDLEISYRLLPQEVHIGNIGEMRSNISNSDMHKGAAYYSKTT